MSPRMYLEDVLWLQDNFWKNAIGATYFALGLWGIAVNLMIISIMPEIRGFLSRPLVLLASCQLFVSMLQMCVVFVPVPYMIATDRPYFVNKILINFPGCILLTTQLISFMLQVFLSIYRNLALLSSKTDQLFRDASVFIVVVVSAVIPTYHVAKLSGRITVRRFSLTTLGWVSSESEVISVVTFVAILVLIILMFYIVAFSDLIYRKLFGANEEVDNVDSSTCTLLATTAAWLASDAIAASIVALPRLVAPWLHSLLAVFGFACWPALTLISYDVHVQAALAYRIRGLFKSCSGGGYRNSSSVRSKTRRKREPLFKII